MKELRAGIIGIGSIARVHLANLEKIDSVKLVAACDIDQEKILEISKKYNCASYTSYREMLGREKLDMLFLFTPQVVREEPIKLCILKDIAVFTEKPPARDLETAKRIEKIVENHSVLVSVGFVFRYLRIVEKAIHLLKGRKILLLQCQYLCPIMYPDSRLSDFFYNRELSGGLVIDQAIHLLDLCRYLLQDEIEEVHAYGANSFQPKTKKITTEESVVMNMRSKKGTLISYLHTWVHRGWSSCFEIFAPNVRLTLDLFHKKLEGTVDEMRISFCPEDNGYLSEISEFTEVVKGNSGSQILSNYSDSVKTMELAVGIAESIDTDSIVNVEEDPSL